MILYSLFFSDLDFFLPPIPNLSLLIHINSELLPPNSYLFSRCSMPTTIDNLLSRMTLEEKIGQMILASI